MQKNIREVDSLARLGGDEFALILPYLHQEKDVIKIIKKITRQFSKGFWVEHYHFTVTLSIGISLYPKDGTHDLLKKADYAMYYVKKHGKNNFSFFHLLGKTWSRG